MILDIIKSFAIGGNVGNNMPNDPEDVRTVKGGLEVLEYNPYSTEETENEPHGYMTREMDTAVRDYQRDKGARVDGFLRPKGETETAMREDLYKIAEREEEEKRTSQPLEFNPVPQTKTTVNKSNVLDVFKKLEKAKKDNQPETANPMLSILDQLKNLGEVLEGKKENDNPYIQLAEANTDNMTDADYEDEADSEPVKRDATGRQIVERDDAPEEKQPPETKQYHTIDDFLPRIQKDEGGYTSGKTAKTADDPRGKTNIGINKTTLEEYESYKKQKNESLPDNYTKVVKDITPELARQIYDEMYYKRYNTDKIKDKRLAGHILDININPGPGRAGRWLQESLNKHLGIELKVDGIIGSQTIKRIDQAIEENLIEKINNDIADKRLDLYTNQARQERFRDFKDGWTKRAESYYLPESSSTHSP